jgi:hypothetical protein
MSPRIYGLAKTTFSHSEKLFILRQIQPVDPNKYATIIKPALHTPYISGKLDYSRLRNTEQLKDLEK